MSDPDHTLTKVQQVFQAAFDMNPQLVTMETNPKDIPAWDSVGHLELVSKLELAFGVAFDVDEVIEMENVREIVRIIEPKLSKKV